MDIPVERASVSLMDQAPGTIRPGELVSMLRKKAWVIVALAAAGGIGAYVYAASLPKSYTSSAALAVEGDRFAIPELEGALRDANTPDQMPVVRTEMQALTSRDMIAQAVKQLDLASDPEFNAALRPPTLIGRVNAAIHSLLPRRETAPGAGPDEGVLLAASNALTTFQDNRSLVIDVSFTARDPGLAAKFVNTLIADYLAARSKWRNLANEGASADMMGRIATVRADLDAIEQKMRALRSQSGAVGLRAGSVGQQQLEELASAADRATLERAQAQAGWQRAAAAAKAGDSASLANVLGSETISRLRDQESQTSRRIADIAAGHGESYPGLVGARSDLAAIHAQEAGETQRIVASLGAQLEVAQAHEADVKRQLANARDTAVSAQNTEAELSQLQADANSQRQVYQTLLERSQQAIVQTAGKTPADMPDVRLLSAAVPSGFPTAPNMKLAGGLGMAGGAVLGCLMAFLRLQREDGFADARALAGLTGMAATAPLPARSLGRRPRLLESVSAMPGGAEAEALRHLRARLRGMGRSVRNVTFIPAGTEDPAVVAAAFARVATSDGERVLLVEGDFAHPALRPLLGAHGGAFEDALRGHDDWRDVIGADSATPLDVLAAAGASDDGQALLGGVTFQNLLMEARDDYSLVVMTAPRAADAGARTLAQRSDASVLIVDGRRARRADVRAHVERLQALSRNPLVGLLVSR